MLNFNEENQDEENIKETPPVSSQDALLAIEKVNLFVGIYKWRIEIVKKY